MRDAKDEPTRRYFHALQNTFKILINSFYGYLGFAQGNFADFEAAARVTQTGRDLLKQMIEWLKAQGAQVIEVDTDGIYFVPPDVMRRCRAAFQAAVCRDQAAVSRARRAMPALQSKSCNAGWRKSCRRGSRSNSTNNSTPCSATRRRTTRFSPRMAKW